MTPPLTPTAPLLVRVIGSDPETGDRVMELNPEASRTVRHWLEKQGVHPEDTIRGYRRLEGGTISFTVGCGYNVLDQDLLDGDGSGTSVRRFEAETGTGIEFAPRVGDGGPMGHGVWE